MKRISLFLLLVVSLLSTRAAVSQVLYTGKVAEVVDGKTVVLEIPSGKMRVVLQYIDVPEAEQPFHQIAIDHLDALTRGRRAEFRLVGIASSDVSGRLQVDGTDISLQMLRDGAAWLVPSEKSGQSQEEFEIYKSSEEKARNEKLGIWSVPNLKPAWEIRAEKEEKVRQELASKPKPLAKLDIVSQFQTISGPGRPAAASIGDLRNINREAWLDVFARAGIESDGVHSYVDPQHRFTVFYTSVAFVNLAGGSSKQRVECRVMYFDLLLVNGDHRAVYLIGFRAISDDYNFSKHASRLTLTADSRSYSIPLLGGLRNQGFVGAQEMMFYKTNSSLLQKIGSAQNVQVRINNLSGPMGKDLQSLIGQLAAGT